MSRSLVLVCLVAILGSACDTESGGIASTDALVGAWLLEGTTSHSYATTSEPQTAMDMRRPGTGGIVVGGAHSGTLRYVTSLYGFGPNEDPSVTLSTYPTGQDYPSTPWMTLHLTRTHAYLVLGDGYSQTQYSAWFWETPSPVTLSETALELAPISFEVYDSQTGETRVIRASGTLTFATQDYPAGVEVEVQTAQYPYTQEHIETRFVFEPEGAFRAETSEGGRTVSREGRWEASEGRLRIGLKYAPTSETITSEYQYRMEDGALVLAYQPSFCPTSCLRNREFSLRLPSGSLASARDEFVYRYVPSTSLALPGQTEAAGDTPADLQNLLTPGLSASAPTVASE